MAAIIDSAGNLVVEYKYDAWGNITHMFGSLASTLGEMNPFRYRGYVYDVETGLYYLRSRYYNPEWGRFINADTVLGKVGALGTHNLFAYCANNPVMMVDPSGHFAWVVFLAAAVIGMAAGQTAYAPATEEDIPEPSGISVWWEDVAKPWLRDSRNAGIRVFDIHTQQAYTTARYYDEWLHTVVFPNIHKDAVIAGIGGAVGGGVSAIAYYSSVTVLSGGTALLPVVIKGCLVGFFAGYSTHETIDFLNEITE